MHQSNRCCVVDACLASNDSINSYVWSCLMTYRSMVDPLRLGFVCARWTRSRASCTFRHVRLRNELLGALLNGARSPCSFSQRERVPVSSPARLATSGKRLADGTPARDPAAGDDVDNDSAEANDEVAELAKRLCVSSLSSEGADAPSSGAVAGGAGAGGEVAAARRVWLRGYAFWWNRTDNT